MKLHHTPSAENLPRYRQPPPSGNDINGLGVREKIRAKRVFHDFGRPGFAWSGMNGFFLMNNTWAILKMALSYRWKLRRSTGPVAKKRVEVTDPAAMAVEIKAKARACGAGIVGITDVLPTDFYESEDSQSTKGTEHIKFLKLFNVPRPLYIVPFIFDLYSQTSGMFSKPALKMHSATIPSTSFIDKVPSEFKS